MIDVLAETRRRIAVTDSHLPDATLLAFIDLACALVDQWVPVENRQHPLYAEAVTSLAIKVTEVSTTGVGAMDPAGDYQMPAVSAYDGLTRTVWAYIAPLIPTGTVGFA